MSFPPERLHLVRAPSAAELPDFARVDGVLFTVRAMRPGQPEEALAVVPSGAADRAPLATYERLSVVPGSRLGDAHGVLIGLTDCGDPSRLDEFHRFYDEHHALDVVRSGFYAFGVRYVRVAGEGPEFLALYGGPGEEPANLQRYLASPERDRTRCDVFLVREVFVASRS